MFQSASAISHLFPLPFPASSWRDDVSTLYRRIHFLRAQGASAEAERLTSVEWPCLLETLSRAAVFSAAELEELLALEADRLATAHAVAEFLAPLMSGQSSGGKPVPRPPPAARSPDPGARGDSPKGIADFIDEMLTAPQKARPPVPRS